MAKFHVTKNKCCNTWHPLENPLYERMRAGLITWYGRLDGIFPYAYRHVFQGNPYYDESQGAAAGRSNERNSMYTYPAANGIIPTMQWEGMREGMDDLRYLATLREFMEAAGKAPQGRVSSETLAKARETLARPPAVFKKYEPFAIYKQLRPRGLPRLESGNDKNDHGTATRHDGRE